MNRMRSVRITWQKSRMLAIMSVLVVLNLSFGAPLLCRLHCSMMAGEMASVEDTLLHREHDTIDGGLTVVNGGMSPIADSLAGEMLAALLSPASISLTNDLPRLNCLSEQPRSNHLMVSATYEVAGLSGDFPNQTLAISALMPAPQAALVSLYIPPPEKPPTEPFDS